MSRYSDPQHQVLENCPYLFNLKPNIYKSGYLSSHFFSNISDLISKSNLKMTIVVFSGVRVDRDKTFLEMPTHQRPRDFGTLFWFDVGPPSTTLVQHQTNSGATSCVYRAANTNRHLNIESAVRVTRILQRHLLTEGIASLTFVNSNNIICF